MDSATLRPCPKPVLPCSLGKEEAKIWKDPHVLLALTVTLFPEVLNMSAE